MILNGRPLIGIPVSLRMYQRDCLESPIDLVLILVQARCLLTQLYYGFTSGPATSAISSGHRLGLGLPILAPVINDHQQAQGDTDVNNDDYGDSGQVHLYTVLTHCRAQGWGRERSDPTGITPGRGGRGRSE